MSNALIASGAVPKGPSAWAPIFSNEFFSGLFTNRNPLRDPATPFIYAKFYMASRYEALWAGANVEVSPRLTLIRAPGHSVFNSQSFPGIDNFFGYAIQKVNNSNRVRILADTLSGGVNNTGSVYDCTSCSAFPNVNKKLFDKALNAGETAFISVGNTVYMGDGVDLYQYISSAYDWKANYSFPQAEFIVVQDSNNKDQVLFALGYAVPCTAISVTNNVLTATVNSVANISVGTVVTLYGMLSSFLNGVQLTVVSVNSSNNTFTAAFTTANMSENETGSGFVIINNLNGTLSTNIPTNFSFQPNGLTLDGTNLWIYAGPALRSWGIPAPANAPLLSTILNTASGMNWVANTYYAPCPYMHTSSDIYQLTTAGTTAASLPSFGGATVNDGSAVWTKVTVNGSKGWVANSAYAVGNVIYVTWTQTAQICTSSTTYWNPATFSWDTYNTYATITYTYSMFFQCVVAGTSQTSGTNIVWSSGLGTQVVESTGLTWQNIGPGVTRTASATSSSGVSNNTYVDGNIGNSQAVAITNKVLDNNGNIESAQSAGESGASAPTWLSTVGSVITENSGLTWTNLGNSAAVGGVGGSNNQKWVYTYAYEDMITGSVGPAAKVASIVCPINNAIQIQGQYSLISTIGYVNIYRSLQGEAQPYLIAQIPNNGTTNLWTFNDFSPDYGSIGSTMNFEIEADLVGYNSPPPVGFIPIVLHLDAIWGFVGNTLYYSAPGGVIDGEGGWEAFPPTQYFNFQSQGITGWSTNSGLFVVLVNSTHLISGSFGNFSNPVKIADIGIKSPNCFALNGQNPFMFTSDKQLISITPGAGITVDGGPIADLLAAFTPVNTYVTWYVNGTDQRLFVGDGSTGYYNMLMSIPPESPAAVWSAKRSIVGGCSAIKALETEPGVYKMLVGPPSGGGPILYRDITSAQDNGSSYPAWCVLGSNVLAHPGQIAELGFIHAEAKKVSGGKEPVVSVLCDEIYGFPGCPPFDVLGRSEHDPPRLPERKSIYSLRYYLAQTGKPAWCRHLQIKFDFGSRNSLDELLSFTIFGAIHIERAESGR